MKTVATIKLKINVNKDIVNTIKKYSKVITYITDKGFKSKVHNRYKLHHLCYHKARKKFNMPSQFVINANRVASQTLKAVRRCKGSKPTFKEFLPLDFDRKNFTFSFDKVRVATIKGRVDIPIEIPEYYWKYLDWSYQTAQIIKTKKGWFIHITFSREVNPNISCSNGKIVGIDLGINNLAVTSDKQFFKGNKTFIKKWIGTTAQLQSKGSKSAKRKLKQRSSRFRRFQRWTNHNVSKSIVDGLESGDTIVMEDLTYIRKSAKHNKWVHSWGFRQLQSFIEYKAIQKGIRIVYANPYRTSKTCSRCNSTKTVRHSGFVKCLHCGYSLSSDFNASINLSKRYIRNFGLASVTKPNVSSDDAKASFDDELRRSLGTKATNFS